jgi:hypothetical protein
MFMAAPWKKEPDHAAALGGCNGRIAAGGPGDVVLAGSSPQALGRAAMTGRKTVWSTRLARV